MSHQYHDAVATLDYMETTAHAAARKAKAKAPAGWTGTVVCEWTTPWRELWKYEVRTAEGKLWSFGLAHSEANAKRKMRADLRLAGHLRA